MNHPLKTFTGNLLFQSGFKGQKQMSYMQDRVGFKTRESRKAFFLSVKEATGAETWKELKEMFCLPRTSFQNYQYGIRLLPVHLFDLMLLVLPQDKQQFFFKQIFTKPGNWGARKAGTAGMKALLKKYGEETLRRWRQKAGRKSAPEINEWVRKNPKKAYILLRRKKLRKNNKKIKENTKKFEHLFWSEPLFGTIS